MKGYVWLLWFFGFHLGYGTRDGLDDLNIAFIVAGKLSDGFTVGSRRHNAAKF